MEEREKGDSGVPSRTVDELLQRIARLEETSRHRFDMAVKAADDVLWRLKLAGLGVVDKVSLVGPPPRDGYPLELLKSPQEALNPVVFSAYTFLPQGFAEAGPRRPLLVLPHGGIHSNFSSSYANVVKELLTQGYCLIAPEYRGSSGYGEQFFKLIDYGGREIEDTLAARNWMVEEYAQIDPHRVGILGWSHGGLHALMSAFQYPDAYAAAYACVPVSDLVSRMAHKGATYSQEFEQHYHIGKTVHEAPEEYRRRSPAWNAERLRIPLLIHGATNDEDVNVLEVEHLIKSLSAADKTFEYKIYKDAPGGHHFNRLDTPLARSSRGEAYQYLARHLTPPGPTAVGGCDGK